MLFSVEVHKWWFSLEEPYDYRVAVDSEATAETEHQVESRLLLNVVVRESAAILELLAGEDKALLIGRDALLVLDLGFHVVDGVRGLNLEGDSLAREGLNEDLHTTAEAKDEMESGLLLDVVVRKSAAVFKLLTSEDETLLIRRDALLILDLGLHVVDRVRRLDLESDGLAGQSFNKDLHVVCE